MYNSCSTKSLRPQTSSNINEPLDFFLTNELIDEIVREINNFEIKKLKFALLALTRMHLGDCFFFFVLVLRGMNYISITLCKINKIESVYL